MQTVLVLGHRGKLGQALAQAFGADCRVAGRSRADGFEAGDFAQVRALLERERPDLVANAVARTGLDACEREPEAAFRINALLPRFLARCSRELGFRLLHFSTDAVFDGHKTSGPYLESDPPAPLNVYGLTKLGGDCLVAAEAPDAYIFRLSVLAGGTPARPQFLEKMIARARAGETLRVSSDVICSPSSVTDVAAAVHGLVGTGGHGGLFHLANAGSASLWELVDAAVRSLELPATVLPVSHADFPVLGRRPLVTPLASERLAPLRPWREAIRACAGSLG
jgi:dTDP-4-dehydrorhamnose reductase